MIENDVFAISKQIDEAFAAESNYAFDGLGFQCGESNNEQDRIYKWIIRNVLVNGRLQSNISDERYNKLLDEIKDYHSREILVGSLLEKCVPHIEKLSYQRIARIDDRKVVSGMN